MKLVIKIGGALLDDATLVDRCARCIAELAAAGYGCCIWQPQLGAAW